MWLLHFPTIHPVSNFTKPGTLNTTIFPSPKFKESPASMTATQLPANGLLRELMQKHVGVISDGNRRWAATYRGLRVQYGHRTDMPEASPNSTAQLPDGLLPELMPKHVGIIMDGNRRWARERGLKVVLGHRSGSRKLKQLTTMCAKWGIKVLSVFAFSTENWFRPQEEVGLLMRLFREVIDTELEEYRRAGLRISFLGDRSKLPTSVQEVLQVAEETTKANTTVHLLVAMNYSGRCDILQACKSIASKVKEGMLRLEDIENEGIFDQELDTSCAEFPNPDLLIRTSGELRISNFMLWQLAYTELFFVDKNFPDFEEADFIQALRSFQQRHRRFGGPEY